jgi:hypothetical protein
MSAEPWPAELVLANEHFVVRVLPSLRARVQSAAGRALNLSRGENRAWWTHLEAIRVPRHRRAEAG